MGYDIMTEYHTAGNGIRRWRCLVLLWLGWQYYEMKTGSMRSTLHETVVR